MKSNILRSYLLFIAAFTGVYLEITKRGGLGMLHYTVLSNLLVVLLQVIFVKDAKWW